MNVKKTILTVAAALALSSPTFSQDDWINNLSPKERAKVEEMRKRAEADKQYIEEQNKMLDGIEAFIEYDKKNQEELTKILSDFRSDFQINFTTEPQNLPMTLYYADTLLSRYEETTETSYLTTADSVETQEMINSKIADFQERLENVKRIKENFLNNTNILNRSNAMISILEGYIRKLEASIK